MPLRQCRDGYGAYDYAVLIEVMKCLGLNKFERLEIIQKAIAVNGVYSEAQSDKLDKIKPPEAPGQEAF